MKEENIWNMPEKYWKDISKENRELLVQYLKDRLYSDNKEEGTVTNDRNVILKLARHLKNKSFQGATERDMKDLFASISNFSSRDLFATKIILFYRKTMKLKKGTRPECMEWFEYTTKKTKLRHVDVDATKKYFITEEQYSEIMRVTIDPQTKALFETLYLSGARPGEVCSMQIGSIEVDGGIEIKVYESKTKPRKIPLPEYPHNLMHWLDIHPEKRNPENPMWFSMSRRDYGKPLTTWAIIFRLEQACKRAKIPRHKPHDFRKTRATIMFRENIDDLMMAKYFGWEVETVAERRRQYDLRGYDELKKKMFRTVEKPPSYKELEKQRDVLVNNLQKEIADLKNQLVKKTQIDNFIMDSLGIIAKELIKKQGIEGIKEIFKKHHVPLSED